MTVENLRARFGKGIRGSLGPRLTIKELNVICWSVFFVILAPAFCRAVWNESQNGRPVQYTDFIGFYAMGQILNEFPAENLYDPALQSRVCNEIYSMKTGAYGPNPYPPFVGVPFKALARLRYMTAYLLWQVTSLALYVTALVLISTKFFPNDRLRLSLILCLGISFFPFLVEVLFNGQLSSVAFFALSLAFLLEDSERYFLSGLAISLCAYKPTLLVLVIPMLFVMRRFKVLLGVATGAMVLLTASLAFVGSNAWKGYFALLFHFTRAAVGVQTGSMLTLSKYVDFADFSSLVPSGRSWPATAILLACALSVGVALVRGWWKASATDKLATRFAWAATLTWTLLLNVYVPVYDTVLVILSLLISLGSGEQVRQNGTPHLLDFLWPLVFGGSWVTVHFANAWHVQLLTLLLTTVGFLQLRDLRAALALRQGANGNSAISPVAVSSVTS